MSDAIALSSPSGRMSKRARKQAEERLGRALFGEAGLLSPQVEQPSKVTSLLRTAKELRELAARGMSPRKFRKKADELEAQAHRVVASELDRKPGKGAADDLP